MATKFILLMLLHVKLIVQSTSSGEIKRYELVGCKIKRNVELLHHAKVTNSTDQVLCS